MKLSKTFFRSQICLVSPGHLGSNPRLVKEADALAEAGYAVHVIYGDSHPAARFRDASILRHARWSFQVISLKPDRWRYWGRRISQLICRSLFAWGIRHSSIAARAHHPLVPALKNAVKNSPADMYIGHCLAALPAVVHAAARHGARSGFDAEDFHSGESPDDARGNLDNRIAGVLERNYLTRCNYVTASSPLIAEAYRERYGINAIVQLNVFPLAEAVKPESPPSTPSFYWFSQTIGPGRGLESFIEILKRLDQSVNLDLRGDISASYRKELESCVDASLVRLRLLPSALPESMVALSAGYTAGLALELRTPLNRDLCLTNKAFTYLLAGIPVILSRTRAQELLAGEIGPAGLVIDLEQVGLSAKRLFGWLQDEVLQTKARATALMLGRQRFNWDVQKSQFISTVKGVC